MRSTSRSALLARGDVGVGQHEPTADDGRVLDAQYLSCVGLVLDFVRFAPADAIEPRNRLCFDVARAVVAAPGVETVELDDAGAGPAQRRRIATQRAEWPVAGNELQFPVEDREAEGERIEARAEFNAIRGAIDAERSPG